MTKTLTEQFLYGQLLDGYWYINIDGHEDILEVEKGKAYIGGALVARAFMGDKIDKIEVLSAVPSYDEYKRLKERLEIATKALVDILVENPHEGDDDYWDQDKAQQALTKMESLK